MFSSVRRVITNDQRLTELSLHISNTFLNILGVPNKAVFCITPTLSGIPNFSIHLSNPLVTLPRAPITTGIDWYDFYHFEFSQSSDLSLQVLVFFHFFPSLFPYSYYYYYPIYFVIMGPDCVGKYWRITLQIE